MFAAEQGYAAAKLADVGAQAARQADVLAQLDELDRAVARLEKVSGMLCERLAPVQRPTGAEATAAGGINAPREMLSPVADRIRGASEAIGRVEGLLQWNHSRLEV